MPDTKILCLQTTPKILCLQTTPWTLLPDECRAWLVANPTTSCRAARRTRHRSRRTLSPSRSPTLGLSPSHVARGREEAVVSSGPPVHNHGCYQCRSRRSDEATRGRRSERTTTGRECDGATRGDVTTSWRDEATRGWRSERTTIGQECGGATRG